MDDMNERNLTDADFPADALAALDGDGSILLTGRAGSGKTTLLRHWMRTRRPKGVYVTAATGIAARNLADGGLEATTLHAFLGVGGDTTVEGMALAGERARGDRGDRRRRGRIADLTTLVVDEASMLRSDMADKTDAFLRAAKDRPDVPFGGVRLILTGDLRQLPPVVVHAERKAFDPDRNGEYGSPYFFDAPAIRDLMGAGRFHGVALKASHRQTDPDFVRALDLIREGRYPTDVRRMLESRVSDSWPSDATVLCATRKRAFDINRSRIDLLPTDGHMAEAVLSPALKASDAKGRLQWHDLPVERTMVWAVGEHVVMVGNDPDGRWANGSIGLIVGVDGGLPVIRIESTGCEHVVTTAEFPVDQPGADFDTEIGRYRPKSKRRGSVEQLPFIPGYALTVHRSQGLTLDRVHVDLDDPGKHPFRRAGQLYVAVSRVPRLDGLTLSRAPLWDEVCGPDVCDPSVTEFLDGIAL
ncbi:ATP-dependent DNA helicase [Bifidobacterium myosotis]|nr:DEAD/DEAH box helicase [Bifidobacterium myosotis]